MILADLRCSCGASAIFALAPGVEPLKQGTIDLFTRRDKVLERGEAARAWCVGCWTKRFTKADPAEQRAADLFQEPEG